MSVNNCFLNIDDDNNNNADKIVAVYFCFASATHKCCLNQTN